VICSRAHIMSQTINIPIRFQFLRTPCVWEVRTVTLDAFAVGAGREPLRMLFAKTDPRRPDLVEKPQPLNAWELRDEFFKLAQNENSLLGFLSKVGVWHSEAVAPYVFTPVAPFIYKASKEMMQHCEEGHPPPVSVEAIWDFNKSLKESLVNRKRFVETRAPSRRPRTGLEALVPMDKFDLSFQLERNPEGVVIVTGARQMLITTVYVDIVRDSGFKYCRRSDCKALVPITNNHEKFYCSQPCAHLDNVRKKRREAREAAERGRRGRHLTLK
jgi:hypothetical protein